MLRSFGRKYSAVILFAFSALMLVSCLGNDSKNQDSSSSGKTDPGSKPDSSVHETVTDAVLFSSASMPVDYPAFEGTEDTNLYRLPDADWRQLEFISKTYSKEVEAEMKEVSKIIKESFKQGQVVSYKRMYVREKLHYGLSISINDFCRDFHVPQSAFLPIGLRNHPGRMTQGFVVQVGKVHVYGERKGSEIISLGLPHGEDWKEQKKVIRDLMRKENLELIDWDTPVIIDPAQL